MKHISVVLGTILLTILSTTMHVKTGWIDGLGPTLTALTFTMLAAIIFSKAGLVRQPRILPFRFREIVVTASMVFGALASNGAMNFMQLEVFGKTYTTPYTDPKPEPGSVVEVPPPTVAEKTTEMFLAVTKEEVTFRWIILSSLLMVMTPAGALFTSSLLFAGSHLVLPILLGKPVVGLLMILPTFGIGIFSGWAFLRHGLVGAIAVHFTMNMVVMLMDQDRIYKHVSVSIVCASAAIALIVLPLTLWFTRRREALAT